jgi:hypothetical protein
MSCLENIISLNDKCGNIVTPSLSGYYLQNAPEITPLALSAIANEKYIDGATLAQAILNNSLLDIKNDFLAVLSANDMVSDVTAITYTTSEFNITTSFPETSKERGLTLYKTPQSKNKLKKVTIKTVSVLPLVSKEDGEILIYDNGNVYTYPVEFTANMINTIEVNHIVEGTYARVLVDNSDLPVSSSTLICFTGCNGKLPNDCGYTKGYNGDGDISSKEGYGVSIDFQCECDYESILCDLAKTYIGKLIYLKTRIGLLDERINSNRLNNFIIYGIEEAKDRKKELDSEYTETWNTLVASLPNLLKKYIPSDCLTCNRTSWRTNI